MKNGEIIYKKFPDSLNEVLFVEDNNIILVNTNYHCKTVLNLLIDEKEHDRVKSR
jgi:hypothetical protein